MRISTTIQDTRRASALVLLLTLAACGGGGALPLDPTGSGGTVQPPIDGGNDTGGGDDGGGDTGGGDTGGGDTGGGDEGGTPPVTVTVLVGENGFSPS